MSKSLTRLILIVFLLLLLPMVTACEKSDSDSDADGDRQSDGDSDDALEQEAEAELEKELEPELEPELELEPEPELESELEPEPEPELEPEPEPELEEEASLSFPLVESVQPYGAAFNQYAGTSVLDRDGNLFLIGSFSSKLKFGETELSSSGSYDIYIAKLGADGALLWAKSFGDARNQWGVTAAVDSAGNVFVTGAFEGMLNFGCGEIDAGIQLDAFLVKLNASGSCLWHKAFGDSYDQIGTAVAVDSSDNVLLAGVFNGLVNLGSGPLTMDSDAQRNLFVGKYSTSGDLIWGKVFGDDYNTPFDSTQFRGDFAASLAALAVDSEGNSYLAGYFYQHINFGGTNETRLVSLGERDIYLVSLAADGSHRWSRRFGDGDQQESRALNLGEDGNLYLTGIFRSTVDFGGGNLVAKPVVDAYLVSFTTGGEYRWAANYGTTGSLAEGRALASAPGGGVVLAGDFNGGINLGFGESASAANVQTPFLARFGADGVSQWAYVVNGQYGTTAAISLAARNAEGRLYFLGESNGRLSIGDVQINNGGGSDFFLVRFFGGL